MIITHGNTYYIICSTYCVHASRVDTALGQTRTLILHVTPYHHMGGMQLSALSTEA